MKLPLVLSTALALVHWGAPQELAADPGSAARAAAFVDAARQPAETVASASTQAAAPVGEPKTVLTRAANWFVYPEGCEGVRSSRTDGGEPASPPRIDVVLHFHGAHTTVVPRYLKSGTNAILLIMNKGIGSGHYSRAFQAPQDFDFLLDRIEASVAEECELAAVRVDRIALSSWSAGYGAVEQILAYHTDRIDAVLVSDGIHVGFSNKHKREVAAERLGVYTQYAKRAADQDALMLITHSSIQPPDYASAGETAAVLTEQVDAFPVPVAQIEVHGMQQLSAAGRGNFFVRGFAGEDKAAHAKQLYAIGDTMFSALARYWQRPPPDRG